MQAPTVSLLADHFPPERRGAVPPIMKLGSPPGSIVGATSTGLIGSLYGWRTSVVLIAVPGLIVALLFKLTLREPARGTADPNVERLTGPLPTAGTVFKIMAARPEFRHMLVALAAAELNRLKLNSRYMAPAHSLPRGRMRAKLTC